jgi:hypothetical protein
VPSNVSKKGTLIMDANKQLVGWSFAAFGGALLYAAIKGVRPSQVVDGLRAGVAPVGRVSSGTGSVVPSAPGATTGSNPVVSTNVDGVARAVALQSRKFAPDLVSIQGGLRLDRKAAESFQLVKAAYGVAIPLVGAWRSAAEQADGYNRAPGVFATPGKSLHEVGIAVDVSEAVGNRNDPKLVAAFQSNGWFRRGKRMSNGLPEEWHWSWMVPG